MAVVSTLDPKPTDTVRIFPAAHNWASDYSVSMEYLTDVFESGSGREQRRAVRERPRWRMEGNALYTGEAKMLLDYFFAAWQPYRAIAPFEHLGLTMRSPMAPNSAGASFVWEDTVAPVWLKPGSKVILRNARRPGAMETRTVSSVSPGSVTFSEYSPTEFPIGSKIFLTVEGFGGPSPTSNLKTNRTGTMSFSFTVDPTDDVQIPDGSDPVYIGAKEVLQKKMNWRDDVGINFVWSQDVIDYGFGDIGTPVPFNFASRVTKANFLARNRLELWDAMKFFERCQGRRQSFFRPTFEDDIPYIALIGGSNAILVEGRAFAAIYKDDTVYRRIALRMVDGTFSYHLVDFIEPLPSGQSVLWVQGQLPVTELSRENILGISWVLNSRFENDQLTFVFKADSVAEYSMAFRSLENFEL